MKKINELDKKIGDIIRDRLYDADITQKDIAEKIGIAPSSLNQMLSGVAPLPLERFCQIISIIHLDKNSVNKAFAIYRGKLSIPDEALVLLDGAWIQQRMKSLLAKPESELSTINRKEIEVIRFWNNGFQEQVVNDAPQSDASAAANDELVAFTKTLDGADSRKALGVLKLMFGER